MRCRNDTLDGGSGDDTCLDGGEGDDTYVYRYEGISWTQFQITRH